MEAHEHDRAYRQGDGPCHQPLDGESDGFEESGGDGPKRKPRRICTDGGEDESAEATEDSSDDDDAEESVESESESDPDETDEQLEDEAEAEEDAEDESDESDEQLEGEDEEDAEDEEADPGDQHGIDAEEVYEGDDATGVAHLDLDGLFLDVLGLEVNLNEVTLDVSARPGDNNLLGNLLSSVTGLLDGLGSPLESISNLLGKIPGGIKRAATGLLGGLKNGLSRLVPGFGGESADEDEQETDEDRDGIGSRIADWFRSLGQSLVDSLRNLFSRAVSSLPLEQVIASVLRRVIGAIVERIDSAGEADESAGEGDNTNADDAEEETDGEAAESDAPADAQDQEQDAPEAEAPA